MLRWVLSMHLHARILTTLGLPSLFLPTLSGQRLRNVSPRIAFQRTIAKASLQKTLTLQLDQKMVNQILTYIRKPA